MILSVARRVTPALGAVVALAACGDTAGRDAGERPYVVATTGIWADIAGRVACDGSLDVRTIVPAGGDPHSFEPSLADRQTLDGATLVVANGLGLEETLDDTLQQVEAGGVPVFRAGEQVDTIGGSEHGGGDEDGDGADPHIWLDPTRVADALPALGAALVEAGVDRATVDGCVTGAQADLARLDEELASTFAAIPAARRKLVTNHDALGYLADRYDLEIVGSVLPSTSTLTEASTGELEELGTAVEEAGVPVIFTERLGNSADAEALADRFGVEVVELYSDALGEEGSGADTYDGMLRTDATAIADALS